MAGEVWQPAVWPGLPAEARELVRAERDVLMHLRESLVGHGGTPADLELLRQADRDLDELFLLVVVGEFNAGKSALINALVGEPVLPEGVTPTTAAVTRVRYAEALSEERRGALVEVGYPLDLLREVAIVDTPGTNAILREHEEITNQFVPRADLILFATSADRPFTESERVFMERIRAWSKRIVVVLNKVDLLTTDRDVADQVGFVRSNVERLLGFSPEIFPVSARLAQAARTERDPERRAELWARSGFGPLEAFVRETLDERGRLQLKLGTPLGVAERVASGYVAAAEQQLALLADDLALSDSIEAQIKLYQADLRRDFEFRLEEFDNVLHEMSQRGLDFLDERLQIRHIRQLFDRKRLREDFERIVIADVPERIDRATQALVDWTVDQDLRLWRAVTEQVERRRAGDIESPIRRLAGSFEYDRQNVLRSLGETAQRVVQQHDHRREAEQLAESVRDAVTQTTLIEASAIGLGAATLLLVSSIAVDVTGLFAASVLAGLGLFVLPRKRRQAKEQFRVRTEELRERLLTTLREEFQRELDRGVQRIKDALAPYDRFVRSEQDRASRFLDDLSDALRRVQALRARIEAPRW